MNRQRRRILEHVIWPQSFDRAPTSKKRFRCKGRKRCGLRCKRRFLDDRTYCPTHWPLIAAGFTLKTSAIPFLGLGVFATRRQKTGTRIKFGGHVYSNRDGLGQWVAHHDDANAIQIGPTLADDWPSVVLTESLDEGDEVYVDFNNVIKRGHIF